MLEKMSNTICMCEKGCVGKAVAPRRLGVCPAWSKETVARTSVLTDFTLRLAKVSERFGFIYSAGRRAN